tara:strand:- start:7 stop:630 length:624 start_codon:yes stop_codon:yes gene_type:complete
MDKIFPYNVFKFKIKDYKKLNENLISEIYNLKNKNKEGINRSNAGGAWHSSVFRMFDNEYPNLEKLRKIISKYFSKEISVMNKDIETLAMWVNINGKDSYNQIHDHRRAFYSGVYYIKVPKNSGNLYFYNPEIWFTDAFEKPELFLNKKYDKEKIKYDSKEGDLYFFVGDLPHGVEKNISDEDRISVSFNFNFGHIRKQLGIKERNE